MSTKAFECKVSCTGLYADVYRVDIGQDNGKDHLKFLDFQEEYNEYKTVYARNIVFNQDIASLGKYAVFEIEIIDILF